MVTPFPLALPSVCDRCAAIGIEPAGSDLPTRMFQSRARTWDPLWILELPKLGFGGVRHGGRQNTVSGIGFVVTGF